jgi:hypothetical protein
MKELHLSRVDHSFKMGDECPYFEPNVFGDCLLVEQGEVIGFFLKSMPQHMRKLAEIANAELRSSRVPKTNMDRPVVNPDGDGFLQAVSQYSVILGSCAPKRHLRRPYPARSSVHSVPSARTFIKAMLMLAHESEELIRTLMPAQYQRQSDIFERVPPEWRFGRLFTSSISNYNISAAFHRDALNIVGCVNVIICMKAGCKGGDLHVPDYNATFGQQSGSVLVYPAWKNLHGVTPIIPTTPGGYRNSLIFYPLKAFVRDDEGGQK